MAAFLQNEKGLDHITVRDIHDFYTRTHGSAPKNLSVSLQQNVNKDYLTRTGDRKEGVRYNLSDKGSEYLDNNFNA